jgi:hypothetical protein
MIELLVTEVFHGWAPDGADLYVTYTVVTPREKVESVLEAKRKRASEVLYYTKETK